MKPSPGCFQVCTPDASSTAARINPSVMTCARWAGLVDHGLQRIRLAIRGALDTEHLAAHRVGVLERALDRVPAARDRRRDERACVLRWRLASHEVSQPPAPDGLRFSALVNSIRPGS